MSILELKDIHYEYKTGQKALSGVSLDVREGEAVTILGTNGCGKSTLLYIMKGLIAPTSGSLNAFGREGLDENAKARISILFQNSQAQLFSLTVRDELLFGPLQEGLSPKRATERAEDIARVLGIEGLLDRSPWQLSGGEMKKVALATCLTTNPDIYLLDEPTSGLDPRSQVELVELILKLKEAGKTVITATHDLHIVADISDRTVVLGEDHTVLARGGPERVLRDQETLLLANLIHRHQHAHGGVAHEHSHYGAHGHDAGGYPAHAHSLYNRKGKEAGRELEKKLKILIEHWMEHNLEHVSTYADWARKAEEAGKPELGATLKEIASESQKLNALFERARRQLD